MATSKKKPAGFGLRLTVGGAPDTPHVIPTIPGVYRPGAPAPVGGPGELDLAEARRLAADDSVPLELVEVPDPDAEREWVAEARAHSRAAVRASLVEARQTDSEMEVERIKDEADAVGKEG
jgi:hypothetical protein